jgi:hypothetical protein
MENRKMILEADSRLLALEHKAKATLEILTTSTTAINNLRKQT